MEKPPVKELYAAALDVIRVGISVLPDEERARRAETFAEGFRRVAEASGGGLGRVFGRGSAISPEEEALIESLTAALRG